jgi:uncharacterized secreted protein with C-terminal beta-propeller domain
MGIVVAVIFGFAFFQYQDVGPDPYALDPISSFIERMKIPSLTGIFEPSKPKPGPANLDNIAKFASEQEFKDYLEESQALTTAYYGGISMGRAEKGMMDISMEQGMPTPSAEESTGFGAETPDRVSETNVQVSGIDEPDIVKTDGKEIYFSPQRWYYPMRAFDSDIEEMIAPGSPGIDMPKPRTRGIKAIKAFPPSDLKVDSEIEQAGNLLLSENVLVVFSGQDIIGYDVSDPKNIEQKWDMELEKRNYLVSSRLYKGKVYLVTKNRIDSYRPCPIKIFNGLEIGCSQIYYPRNPVPVDVTFSAMVLNPDTGKIENTVSFVGSSSQSIVYMSENGIYITYSYNENMINFFYGFFQEECADIVPSWVLEKLEKLKGYDISDSAKMMEFRIIFNKFESSLDDDERMRLENEFTNRMDDYYAKHKRDFEKTGIVKIGLSNFDVAANGVVSGRPLNQFSLDEYQGYLRVATTIGDSGMGGMFWGIGESANDVYVTDSNLNITGSVKDLGLTEKIYSVRFIADKGYVVTFRDIDPFYVLDLSDPYSPELKGELKIPGYSSYLHPINKDRILGMGKEGSKVKVSLFDVRTAENPKEADKYILDEYWSDVLNTHHAFLLDAKHKIFFLPGSRGGYIFSYENDKLKLIRAVSGIAAKRAIYIDDYLYIVGEDKIIVLDETNWEEINNLKF